MQILEKFYSNFGTNSIKLGKLREILGKSLRRKKCFGMFTYPRVAITEKNSSVSQKYQKKTKNIFFGEGRIVGPIFRGR